ncbi:MAG: DUF5683 domain-containing protein [Saprospiraceae bacterium]
MKGIISIFLTIIFIFMINENGKSQVDLPKDTILIDSTDAIKLGLFDKENKKTFKMLFSGKPARAGFYSLIFPGGGQIYNKKYWKVPLAWALVGTVGYFSVKSQIKYHRIDFAYKCMVNGGDCIYTYQNEEISDVNSLYDYRYKYRAYNERQWVLFSFVYLIQVIEAYVDRHLIDFDLDKNLSFQPIITPQGTLLSMSFNLNYSKNKSDFNYKF